MEISLLTLPDSVLLKILSYLNAAELYLLSSLHPRFAQLTEDKSLWRHVHFGHAPLTPQAARRFIRYLGKHTRSIHMKGFVKSPFRSQPKGNLCLSDAFFSSLKRRCTNLEELFLHGCYIDSSTTKLSNLPPSLKKLSLLGTSIVNLPMIRSRLNSPFFKIGSFLPNLEEINVEACRSWCTPVDISTMMKLCNSLKVITDGRLFYIRDDQDGWKLHGDHGY